VTPAEELAQAAVKLYALADAATGGPWVEAGIGEFGWSVVAADHGRNFGIETEDSAQGKADATYVAAMNPLVGKSLAEWLLDERVRGINSGHGPNSHALAIARLINGSAS